MPTSLLPLSAVFVLCLAVVLWAAGSLAPHVMIAASAVFAGAAILAAWRANAAGSGAQNSRLGAIRETSRVTAMSYLWGGLAMLLIYRLTALHWQHGWQYGLAMLLIAAGLGVYIQMLASEQSAAASDRALDRAVYLAVLQGAAAVAALLWLTLSGKIWSPKGDWAANIVFISGGFAIAGISAIVVIRDAALKRAAAGAQR